MPEIMGAGVGMLEVAGTDDTLLILANSGPQGAPRPLVVARFQDGKAQDAQHAGTPAFAMGVACGDVDGDGQDEVLVTAWGQDRLYRLVEGKLVDCTEAAGLPQSAAWSASAAFADFDSDGDLDLFITRYVAFDPKRECLGSGGQPDYCGPRVFPGVSDVLLLNDGQGRFRDVTAAKGLIGPSRRGLGVVAADLTGDGRLDFYVANDNEANQLWVQGEDGRFTEEAVLRGLAFNLDGKEEASMGIVCEDLDGDLDLDLWVTHLEGESSTLYIQVAPGEFEDRTGRRGLEVPTRRFTGFGAVAFDADGDGDLDLAAVNGHVFRRSLEPLAKGPPFWRRYAQPGQLLMATETGFEDVPGRGGAFTGEAVVGRGLAVGDLDRDGAQDLLVGALNRPLRVHRGRAVPLGQWLSVQALEGATPRNALGARVTVWVGDRCWTRRIATDGSYLSSSLARAHFAWEGPSHYDRIEVTWSDGEVQSFPGGDAGQFLRLLRS